MATQGQGLSVAEQSGAGQAITTENVQQYLLENQTLILAILENQNLGKLAECAQYQQRLQQNLMFLAAMADAGAAAAAAPPPPREPLQHAAAAGGSADGDAQGQPQQQQADGAVPMAADGSGA